MAGGIELLKVGFAALEKHVTKRKATIRERLKREERVDDADSSWLDGPANWVDERRALDLLKNASGHSAHLAQITPTAAEAQKAKAMFAAMQKHVLIGEKDPKSGRHTFSAWTSANKDAGRCDSESKLCTFRLNQGVPKTVFDDRAGGFTASDVQRMCTTAITLNIQSSAGKLQTAAFVVQTKFGHPICVQHLVAEQGSCFPLGIHATSDKLSTECSPGSGNKFIAGKTTEIPAR
ncbi:hypothetical protein DFH09DRAFT_1336136 [Mycena vulgaris]|nr:hypothetical protein DFH09DRAFT_1336136 [Mycena vulgaris]